MRSCCDRNALIDSYHYLCSRAARKFVRDGVERSDLEQVAAIGLIKAAERFDADQGTPFEAYAWVLILGELMHYVRDSERMVRVPRKTRDLERRWSEAERQLWMVLGRDPSIDEIAQFVGVSPEEEKDVRACREARHVVSVESLPRAEQGTLSYTIERQLDQLNLDAGIQILSAVEKEILVEIYERDTPIFEIARRLGYSRRHIARLHRGALDKLSPYARPLSA